MAYRRPRTITISDEEAEFRRALEAVPPPTPPDGGWGWVVVLSAFLINAIIDGICYSFALYLPEIKHYMVEHSIQPEKYPTMYLYMSAALLLGLYMATGPIASAICNKFNSRSVAMLASIIATFSFVLNVFAKSILAYTLLFAATGIMFGLMFISSILVVGFYFERYRVIAATLAMCGSGVGTAVVPPVVVLLLDEYGWKHTFAILAGFILQGCVLAALYKPLDADLRRRKKIILRRIEEDRHIGPQTCIIMQRLLEEKKRQRTYSTGSMNGVIITRDNKFVKVTDTPTQKPSLMKRIKGAITSRSKLSLSSRSQIGSGPPSRIERRRRHRSNSTPGMSHKPTPLIQITGEDDSPYGSPLSTRRSTFSKAISPLAGQLNSARSLDVHSVTSNTSYTQASPSTSEPHPSPMFDGRLPIAADNISLSNTLDTVSLRSEHSDIVKLYRNKTPDSDRPMYRKDILFTGSIQNLPEYNKNKHIDDYVASITAVPTRPDDPDLTQSSSYTGPTCWDKCSCLPVTITDVLRSVFDTSTLKYPAFIRLAIASFLTMLGYYTPFLMLPTLCHSYKYNILECSYLLTVFGSANVVGRIISAMLGGKRYISCNTINVISLLLSGVTTLVLPFCIQAYPQYTYPILCTYSAIYGLCVAAFSSLRSIIVVDLLGLNKLTTAFSQLVVLNGLAVIVSTPISGLLYDISGHEDWSFYMSGTAITLSGLLCIGLSSPAKRSDPTHIPAETSPSTTQTSSEEEVKKQAPPTDDDRPTIETVM